MLNSVIKSNYNYKFFSLKDWHRKTHIFSLKIPNSCHVHISFLPRLPLSFFLLGAPRKWVFNLFFRSKTHCTFTHIKTRCYTARVLPPVLLIVSSNVIMTKFRIILFFTVNIKDFSVSHFPLFSIINKKKFYTFFKNGIWNKIKIQC